MSEKAKRFLDRKKRRKALSDKNGMYEVVEDKNGNNTSVSLHLSDEEFTSSIKQYSDSYNRLRTDVKELLTWKHGAVEKYCSWCLEKTWHGLVEANSLTRDCYRCNHCKNFTLQCRFPGCDNMATFKPEKIQAKDQLELLKQSWASEFCAEHDGTISSFDTLNDTLDDISNFNQIYKSRKVNVVALTKTTGIAVATAGSLATGAWFAAPWAASALGALGVLGTAGTGTAISTLSGAALTSASLAAIGPGGVVGGMTCISAAGAALGARKGAAIGAGYFGDINGFDIKKIKEGKGPSIIFINGFLTQSDVIQQNQDEDTWLNSIKTVYPDNPCYILSWESSSLLEIGRLFAGFSSVGGKPALLKVLKGLSKKGASVFTIVDLIASIVNNPWHKAVVKSEMTGVLLADIIARTLPSDGFILAGHSLGARVAYYTMAALSTLEGAPLIKRVYLLGGAVGNDDSWQSIAAAVEGEIYNVYSKNDDILRYAYTTASAFSSEPIGLGKIIYSNSVNNFNASNLVMGHREHKRMFGRVLQALHDN